MWLSGIADLVAYQFFEKMIISTRANTSHQKMSLLEQYKYEWATVWLNHVIKQNKYAISWWDISINPCVTIRMLKQFPNHKWDWSALSRNSNISLQMIQDFKNEKWDWDAMSTNPFVSAEIILHYADKPWDFMELSQNENITIEVLKKMRNKPWDWYLISQNKNITKTDIERNMNMPWHVRGICWNPNINSTDLNTMPILRFHYKTHGKQQNNLPDFVTEDRKHYFGCYHGYTVTHRDNFIERKFVAQILVAMVEFYKNADNYVCDGKIDLCCYEMVFANDYLASRIVAY